MSTRIMILRYIHILNKLRTGPASFKEIDWYLENQKWLDGVTSGSYMDYYKKMYEERDTLT